MEMKNPRIAGIFYAHYVLGLSAPNPDTKDFSRKVLWNLKSFTKIKCVFRCESSLAYLSFKKGKWEILWHTFLIRKVCSFAYFSYKKSRSRKND